MYELNRHKKNDKIKWAFTGIAFLLVFVMFTGLCLQLFGTGKQKPSEWFKKPDIEQTQPETPDNGEDKPAIDENGKELASDIIYAMPARMTFRTAKSLVATAAQSSAYDSVTVQATVTPDIANLKSVVYSVSWVNASSEWANGKTVTEYVTATQTKENSKTATIQCLQPFGEQVQVKVTATGIDNSSASATCTVDFMKRVASWSGQYSDGSPVEIDLNTSEIRLNSVSVSGELSVMGSVEYTAFTVDNKITVAVELSADKEILSGAESTVGIKLVSRDISCYNNSVKFLHVVSDVNMRGLTESSMAQYVSPFREWLYNNRTVAVFCLKIKISSGKQSIEKTIPIYFSDAGIAVPVSGVTLDQSNVII